MLHNQQQQSTEGANVNKKDTKHTKEQAAHGLWCSAGRNMPIYAHFLVGDIYP